jgi:transformation/transcription domain-associated protein
VPCAHRCSKELNQWDLLLDYARDKSIHNPFLILEIAWRVPDWNLMKEALSQVETSCPKEMMWKVTFLRIFSECDKLLTMPDES